MRSHERGLFIPLDQSVCQERLDSSGGTIDGFFKLLLEAGAYLMQEAYQMNYLKKTIAVVTLGLLAAVGIAAGVAHADGNQQAGFRWSSGMR